MDGKGYQQQLRCLLATGCPKLFLPAEAPYELLNEKTLGAFLDTPYGEVCSRGYISGKLFGNDVVFQCYGLMPESVITQQNKFDCIIGAKNYGKTWFNY